MSPFTPAWIEHQRRRWTRCNAHLWQKPITWSRVLQPSAWPARRPETRKSESTFAVGSVAPESPLELRRLIAGIQADLCELAQVRRHGLARKYNYNPDQPRVPAGNTDGGQWTDGQSMGRIRLAAAGEPPLWGPHLIGAILKETAKKLIDGYRSGKGLWDLFGNRIGTVSVTNINGKNVFGSNSTSPDYTASDRAAALKLRGSLIANYPDVMKPPDIAGRRPNDAVFHAETNVLLRAAAQNGGTLSGQTMEVRSDRNMCPSCRDVLPLVGMELGNPTVKFIDPSGNIRTMKNGAWEAR